MNNFVLNNTSVYLGGQCQWDIVINKNKDHLEIGGFQLAPISGNVPYNRKGEIRNLNNTHSDTLKRFCSNLKESFWCTDFCADTFINSSNNVVDSNDLELDTSLFAGLKRVSDYSIYKKQFCFFQPVWLENIPEGSYLRFNFTAHPAGYPNNVLGSNWIDLKILDENLFDSFHNQFVNYFNNWIEYVNITSGNDRSMYIDLRKEEARLSGVSTLTGQIINGVNCDYVVSNLLMNERPNVETDYILSTLFKSHNLINSQLFNFNFCFNIDDILSGFIIKQLYGSKIYISCDVYLVNESGKTEKLENRTLFTNYNYVKKSVYNPFIFIDDIVLDEYDNIVETNYECVPDSEQKDNVLEYLKDYEVGSVKDINKLNQNICHWNYTDIKDKNFNLYNGYQYIYCNYNINDINYETEGSQTIYRYSPIEIPYSNGVSIYSYPDVYTGYGELSWMYPRQAIYLNSKKSEEVVEIYQELIKKLSRKGNIGLFYQNHLSIDIMNEFWGTDIQKDYSNEGINKICCAFINTDDWAEFGSYLDNSYNPIIPNTNYNLTIIIDSGLGVILTNNPNCLLLDKLIDICDNPTNTSLNSAVLLDQLSDVTTTLKGIKESILQGNEGYFYQFGKEICIGYNDLNEKTYYKSDTLNTYLYRTGGKISPAFLQDSDHNLNGYYGYNNRNKSVISISEDDADNSFEITKNGSGWRILLDTELNFTVMKVTYNNDISLNDLIKSYLSSLYNITNKYVIDEIFSKYFVSFDYEYDYKIIEGKTQVTTIYKVKLILR